MKRKGHTTVMELTPGDTLIRLASDHHAALTSVFITQTKHPVHPHLQLVVWSMSNGRVSLDALSIGQDVGEVHRPETYDERQRVLKMALQTQGEPWNFAPSPEPTFPTKDHIELIDIALKEEGTER